MRTLTGQQGGVLPPQRTQSACQIGSCPPPISGVGAHIAQLTARLSRAGVRVRTINTSPPRWTARGRAIHLLLDALYFIGANTVALADRSSVRHVHVTTGNSLPMRLPLIAVLHVLRKPVVLTLHSGNLCRFLERSSPIVRQCVRAVFRLADHVITAGEQTTQCVRKIAGSDKVSDIPLFLASGKPDESAVPRTARRFIAGHEPLIAAAGGWRALYDLECVIRAIGILRSGGEGEPWPKLGVVFVLSFSRNDSTRYKARVREEIDAAGLQECVLLLEPGATPHDGVLAILARARVLVRASRSDATGLIIHEAFSQGCAVIASDIGSRPDGCILYPPGDAETLALLLGKVLGEPRPRRLPASSGEETFARIVGVYRMVERRRRGQSVSR